MNLTLYSNKSIKLSTSLFISLLFFIVGFIGIYFHELWADESHHFLLGRDSSSFINLYNNTRYDGHPILWNYIIHLITRFSLNPFYMQLFHITISSIVAFIFIKKSPFELWFKVLFLLGYFMLYEYNIISRNYNLGVLFLFLACSWYEKRNEKFITVCFFLALCCNTHAIFSIISSCFLLSLFIEQKKAYNFRLFKKYWKGYLVFCIGLLLAYIQIIPKKDTPFFERINYSEVFEIVKATKTLFKAHFPIVDFTQLQYWNKFYIIEHCRPLYVILGILMWFLPLFLFLKKKKILVFVYSTCICYVLFVFLIRVEYGTRYCGILFFAIIIGLWMKYYDNPQIKLSKLKLAFVTIIITIQAIAGILAYTLDIVRPFNYGKDVASYIIEKKLPEDSIITSCESASINAYLKDNLFNLCYQKNQGYYQWKLGCSETFNLTSLEVIEKAYSLKQNKETLYLILRKPIQNSEIKPLMQQNYFVSLLKGFEKSVTQNYYIYKIERKKN